MIIGMVEWIYKKNKRQKIVKLEERLFLEIMIK